MNINVPLNEPELMNIKFKFLISKFLINFFHKDIHQIILEYMKFNAITCKDFQKINVATIKNNYNIYKYYNNYIKYNYFGDTVKKLILKLDWTIKKGDISIMNDYLDNSIIIDLENYKEKNNTELLYTLLILDNIIKKIDCNMKYVPFVRNSLDRCHSIRLYFQSTKKNTANKHISNDIIKSGLLPKGQIKMLLSFNVITHWNDIYGKLIIEKLDIIPEILDSN